MKELSIEEKAKRYDEAIERARKLKEDPQSVFNEYSPKEGDTISDYIFPELKENEDERIRKELVAFLKETIEYCGTSPNIQTMNNSKKWLDWLEKQAEQDNNEDLNILQRFSFYSYKDEPNILYLSGVYMNEEYRNKGIGTKILEIADEVAKSLNCNAIRLKTKKNSSAERLYLTHGYDSLATEERDELWLEKQGKQKSADKTKPKFHEGDWVVSPNGVYWHIDKISNNRYEVTSNTGKGSGSWNLDTNIYHKFDIQDAKDGDVLSDGTTIFIFKDLLSDGSVMSYCDYDTDSGESDVFCPLSMNLMCSKITPATKEQRDQLEKAMADAGYTFDFEKKELRKIEQNPINKPKFKVKYAGNEYNVFETKDIAGVTFYGIEDEPNHIDYVKADNCEIISGYGIKESGLSFPTKPVMFSEQKPAWSEEDINMIDWLIRCCEKEHEELCNDKYGHQDIVSDLKRDCRKKWDWLESLKNRVAPQNKWKPSDEQMSALKAACREHYDPKGALYSLCEDLVKLKRE